MKSVVGVVKQKKSMKTKLNSLLCGFVLIGIWAAVIFYFILS